jgi:hypothetical protein
LRRLLVTVGCTAAAGAAALGLGIGPGHADPNNNNSTYNVVGEPYAKAVAILRAQGVRATFGGSVGSDVPQAQCIVASEKVLAGRIQLSLDCTAEAQPQPQQPASTGTASTGTAASGAATSGAPAAETARPTPGAPGIVTVIPKPVG